MSTSVRIPAIRKGKIPSSPVAPALQGLAASGWDVRQRSISRGGIEEHYISISGRAPARIGEVVDGLAAALRGVGARVVSCDVVGTGLREPATEALQRAFGRVGFPVTWLEDRVENIVCVVVWAISGAAVEAVEFEGAVAGVIFEDDDFRYVRLGNMLPSDTRPKPHEQSAALFEKFERVLKVAGFGFLETARTWFFNDDILGWYDEFNHVRREFFKARGVFDRLVPASTGVGVANPAKAGLVTGLFAARPKNDKSRVFPVGSPLQCPAIEYGSAFSRGVELSGPGGRRLMISGTASIEPAGATARVGDLDGQVELTMDVVFAILESRGMNWQHVTRAMAYFSSPDDLGAWDRYAKSRGLPDFPVAVFNAVVCRHDLLFEFEADAVEG